MRPGAKRFSLVFYIRICRCLTAVVREGQKERVKKAAFQYRTSREKAGSWRRFCNAGSTTKFCTTIYRIHARAAAGFVLNTPVTRLLTGNCQTRNAGSSQSSVLGRAEA